MPMALSQMFVTDAEGNIVSLQPEWAQFFHALQGLTFAMTRSGASTERPTSSAAMDFRYTGMPYFDVTLGLPIFLKNVTSAAWVKADGSPA